MTEMRRDVVFVHIPKTGGTSVRAALERTLSAHIVLRDYGKDPQTSPEIRELVYERKAAEEFRNYFGSRARGFLLSGHFPASRYWDSFNAESFITFLRHPIDRIFSAYGHWVRLHGWRGSFEEFLKLPGTGNRLTKLLQDIDMESFGFVGFMEDFAGSIAALGEFVGVELPVQNLNSGNYAALGSDLRAHDKYREMVAELAAGDITLYENLARKRRGSFTARQCSGLIDEGYLGHVQLKEKVAIGWLCNLNREFIVPLRVIRNGVTILTTVADRYREAIRAKGMSRSGVCGFRIDLREYGPGEYSFIAYGSSYELPGSPLRI